MSWTAPESGSGCVVFKASIVEASKQWFSEDNLVKKLCEHNEGSTDVQPEILDTCNACTEAKYEVLPIEILITAYCKQFRRLPLKDCGREIHSRIIFPMMLGKQDLVM